MRGKEEKNMLSKSDNEKEKIRILEIQEKERQRIAAELHDSSLQNLTHLIHKLELCSLYMDKDIIEAKLELADISKELKKTINDIRETIFNLRPMTFDDIGVKEVFCRLKMKLEEMSDMKIHFLIDDFETSDQLILMMIFRLVNECAINAIKHSEGKTLNVVIKENNDFINIVVEDDGKGFDYEKVKNGINGHFGMLLLKERVLFLSGDMQVDTGEKGTKVLIKIPINDKKQEE